MSIRANHGPKDSLDQLQRKIPESGQDGDKMLGRKAKFTRLLHVATIIAAVGGILFGFDTGVISGAILFIQQDC